MQTTDADLSSSSPLAEQAMTTNRSPVRILVLCTHNSARSQIAEALLRHLGGASVEAHSAGTEPSRVHPMALAVLQAHNVDTSPLSSKHLKTFLDQQFDYVITVCDRANESCPIFPGAPARIHWSLPDPSAFTDPAEQYQAFVRTFEELEQRLQPFLAQLQSEEGKA